MSKYDPSEKDLGFNPYIADEETFQKLNGESYSPDNFEHRRRLNKWKEREHDRQALATRLGVRYSPTLTPAAEILKKI